MAIEYKARADGKMNVRVNGRVTGIIVVVDGKYRFRALGTGKPYGDAFDTLTECQRSLEAA